MSDDRKTPDSQSHALAAPVSDGEIARFRARYRFEESRADVALLAQYEMALRAIFATMGAGFYTSGQAQELLGTLAMLGIPREILVDAYEHYTMNRDASPFMKSMMGD